MLWCVQVCETYPRDLYVPITASKPIIVGSSKFRSKGRFPVLTYFYQEKKVRTKCVSLCGLGGGGCWMSVFLYFLLVNLLHFIALYHQGYDCVCVKHDYTQMFS